MHADQPDADERAMDGTIETVEVRLGYAAGSEARNE
jgi:hypothetical protein